MKLGDVYAVYHGGARTLSDFIYVQFLAKVLHPEAFGDIDPEAGIRKFYADWLPVAAEGVFVLRHQ